MAASLTAGPRVGVGARSGWARTAPFLVAAATVLVFWTTLRGAFVNYDDPDFLIRPFRDLGFSSVLGMFTGFHYYNYTPLTLLSLSADFTLWGMNPFGYHLTNLLLHAANAAVFYLLCLEFFAWGGAAREDRWAAAAAALFFSLHPLRVQSVAWVSERRDVLCGFFFLLSLLFWMKSFRPGRLNGARGRAAALGSFALSLLSKPAAVPLPLVLILLDLWPLRRLTSSSRRWDTALSLLKEKLPFAALAALAAAAQVLAQGEAAIDLATASGMQRANQIGLNLVFYLGKLLWPTDLALYEWHWEPIRTAVIVGTAATAVLLVVAARSRRLRAPLLSALAYQTVMLAPTLGFVTIGHEIAADRYSYLSGLAWALLFGAGLRSIASRHRTASLILASALLGAFAAATQAQIPVWANSVSLWKQVVRIDPTTYWARAYLAKSLFGRGRNGEAILYLEEQLRLYPQDRVTQKILHDFVAETRTTVRDHAGFHEQLGLEFAAQGEFDKAAWHFERGLRFDPESERLRGELEKARLSSKDARRSWWSRWSRP
ncbi:MAG: hypothetical protein ACHQ2Z_14200 [Elusimicrobiota bacterium]